MHVVLSSNEAHQAAASILIHPGVRTLDRDVTFSCVSFPVMKYQIQCSSGGKIEIYVFASMHNVVFLTLNIIFSQHVSVCFADPKHA